VIAARSRKLAAVLAVAAVTATLLTACQSRVGAAAYVGSTRISESTVGRYLSRSVTTTIDQTTGKPDNPKSDVVSSLIVTALLDRVFSTIPAGPPSAAQLDSARVIALQQSGAPSVAALEKAAVSAGYTERFADLYLDEQAKIAVLESELKDASGAVLINRIGDLHVKVSVSPRYGNWNLSSLAVSAGPSVPSFLQLAAGDTTTSTGDGTAG
jgi:hypothetical protein